MLKLYRLIPCLLVPLLCGCIADVPFSLPELTVSSTVDSVLNVEFDTTIHEYDGTTATDAANDIVGSDKSFYWEANTWSEKVMVTFNGESATVESSAMGLIVFIDGAYVTVDMATNSVKNVEVIVQGQTDDGSLKIYGKNKFKLTLNDVRIVSHRGPAINDQCKKRVFVHLADGTFNKLVDQIEYNVEPYYASGASFETEDAKGCLFSEGNVILSGSGVLMIDAYHKHGVATDGYLWTRPGVTLAITHAAKNAIQAKGNVTDNLGIVINGGYIYANVSVDGGKCLKTDNNTIINGGYLNLNTSGSTYFDSDENNTSSSTCIKSDMNAVIHGGTIVMKSMGDSGKGINADKSIYIYGGAIYSYTIGRNIAADESLELSNGKVYTFSQNDYAVYSPIIKSLGGYLISISANANLLIPQQKAIIDGGYIFAYGYHILTYPDDISTQSYLRYDGLTIQSGKSIAVCADGSCLIGYNSDFAESYKLPLLFSTPEIVGGLPYTLSYGDSVYNSSGEWQGLVWGGTLSDVLYSIGVIAE